MSKNGPAFGSKLTKAETRRNPDVKWGLPQFMGWF